MNLKFRISHEFIDAESAHSHSIRSPLHNRLCTMMVKGVRQG